MLNDQSKLSILLLFLATVCYVISLVTPVWSCEVGRSPEGFDVLLFGWLFFVFLDFTWLCNLIPMLSIIVFFIGRAMFVQVICTFMVLYGSIILSADGWCKTGSALGEGVQGQGLAAGGVIWLGSLYLFTINTYLVKK